MFHGPTRYSQVNLFEQRQCQAFDPLLAELNVERSKIMTMRRERRSGNNAILPIQSPEEDNFQHA